MSSSPQPDPATLSTEALLERAGEQAGAVADTAVNALWVLIGELHRRPEEAIFGTASAWCATGATPKRVLGADILGQLGHVPDAEQSPFGERSVPVLVELLRDEDPRVKQSAVVALGHLAAWGVDWDCTTLEGLERHADRSVRHAVASALGGRPCEETPWAADVLLRLMTDPDDHVRSWATSGLASSEVDSDAIRAALLARLDDEVEEVRCEAMVGLAGRQDARVHAAIEAALQLDDVPTLAVEAAALLPSPDFIPMLEDLLDIAPDDEDLLVARERCEGGPAEADA